MAEVQWLDDFDEGLEKGESAKKPLFLDFFKDGWGGCAKLDTVTYPDDQVAEMLNQYYVPVQVDIQTSAKLADRYQALWTPNLNVIDNRGHRVYEVIGWLPPNEFAAMLHIGRGYFSLKRKKFEEAAPLFGEVIERYADSTFAPEALYFKGVSRYMATQDVDELKAAWTELQSRYPDSEWAMKSDVI